MYISEQLLNPDARRLRLSAQLGVQHVVLDNRGTEFVAAADQAGVRLACHPHDPAYPVGGLNGIEHLMGSADGILRFMALSDSPRHGLNFGQGTAVEMFCKPGEALIPVIEEFAAAGRIFMVHCRNICGGYLDFEEVFPDEGDVDMFQAIQACQRGLLQAAGVWQTPRHRTHNDKLLETQT